MTVASNAAKDDFHYISFYLFYEEDKQRFYFDMSHTLYCSKNKEKEGKKEERHESY